MPETSLNLVGIRDWKGQAASESSGNSHPANRWKSPAPAKDKVEQDAAILKSLWGDDVRHLFFAILQPYASSRYTAAFLAEPLFLADCFHAPYANTRAY
jgi:hypothetical protein